MKGSIEKILGDILIAYAGKRILITGGQGFIGSSLTSALCNVDCTLVVLDKAIDFYWLKGKMRAEVIFLNRDITEPQTWLSVLPDVDVIFHLASMEYNRSHFNVLSDLRVNTLSVLHMLEACREYGFRPRIIFSSSSNIFGKPERLPVNENERDSPLSLWSVHKLTAEHYLRVYSDQYGIRSITLRLANVYGPTANWEAVKHVVVNSVIAKALAGESLKLYSNKHYLRDYIFLEDVVCAFLCAGNIGDTLWDGRLYIIGSGEGNSIEDVWKLIAKKIEVFTGRRVSVCIDDIPKMEPLDLRDFIADATAFREVAGWRPRVSLEKGIEKTIKALMGFAVDGTA